MLYCAPRSLLAFFSSLPRVQPEWQDCERINLFASEEGIHEKNWGKLKLCAREWRKANNQFRNFFSIGKSRKRRSREWRRCRGWRRTASCLIGPREKVIHIYSSTLGQGLGGENSVENEKRLSSGEEWVREVEPLDKHRLDLTEKWLV